MVENQIIQLPNPKGDLAMFANLKLRNQMLLASAVPIALFVGLVAPVFSSASKEGSHIDKQKSQWLPEKQRILWLFTSLTWWKIGEAIF